MLTSFFRKSGPINFLFVSLYLLLFIGLWVFFERGLDFTGSELAKLTANFILLVFSLFLLDFIIRKNGLNFMNSYAILIFANLICFFPAIFSNWMMVAASVFLLFALRRIVSLQSQKNTERKILDASLWIAIAAFFYIPSLLLLLALAWAIFIMPVTKLRHFFIPIVGVLSVGVIATAYFLMVYDSIQWLLQFFVTPSFDFVNYSKTIIWTAIAFTMASFIWTMFMRMGSLSRIPKKERPNHFLVVIVSWVALATIALASTRDTTEFVIAFAPMAIIISNYLEQDSEIWFKEVLLWLFLLLPFVRFFIS